MSPRGVLKHEKIGAWRAQAEADLTRLQSLSGPQLGAEIARAGFANLRADGERTVIGLANSLCPTAPAVLGSEDPDIISQYKALVLPALTALEQAGLLSSEVRGRSALRFYALTALGQSALDSESVHAILAARA